jgi:hypothetical protein
MFGSDLEATSNAQQLPKTKTASHKETKHILFSVAAFSALDPLGPAFWPPANFLILIWPALMLGSGGTARTLLDELRDDRAE